MIQRVTSRGLAASLVSTSLLALAGCATQPVPVSLAEFTPTAELDNLPEPITPRPAPPANVASNFATPPKLANGSYVTINSNLQSDDVIWHLRSALNVAAISCRGPESAAIGAAYNAMLTADAKPLNAAYVGSRAKYKASFGKDWETQWDQQSTRVYNFFSQSVAHQDFCIAAAAVADQVKAVPGPALGTFAAAVLPRLEQPFTDFYRAYDDYKAQLAAWTAHYGDRMTAGAAGAPVIAQASVSAPVTTTATPPSVPASAGAEPPAGTPRLQYAPVGDNTGTH